MPAVRITFSRTLLVTFLAASVFAVSKAYAIAILLTLLLSSFDRVAFDYGNVSG
jgi:hypothetical protein